MDLMANGDRYGGFMPFFLCLFSSQGGILSRKATVDPAVFRPKAAEVLARATRPALGFVFKNELVFSAGVAEQARA
jgi:hypothetical protein